MNAVIHALSNAVKKQYQIHNPRDLNLSCLTTRETLLLLPFCLNWDEAFLEKIKEGFITKSDFLNSF